MGSLACRPFYRENPAERLRLLEGRSYGLATVDATPNTQAWLANLEAGGHAFFSIRGLAEWRWFRLGPEQRTRMLLHRMGHLRLRAQLTAELEERLQTT